MVQHMCVTSLLLTFDQRSLPVHPGAPPPSVPPTGAPTRPGTMSLEFKGPKDSLLSLSKFEDTRGIIGEASIDTERNI